MADDPAHEMAGTDIGTLERPTDSPAGTAPAPRLEAVTPDPPLTGPVDVVVLGAGPTGENVADRTAAGGLATVIVEAALLGGECSFAACIPTKAMLRGAAALAAARAVDGAAQAVAGPLDAPATFARRTRFTDGDDDQGQAAGLERAGISLVRGRGRLTGPREVTVDQSDGTTVVLRPTTAVVVCTGTVPSIPAIAGLVAAHPWTNREATHAESAPRRLIVLGAGPVGCELATAFRALGSDEVTVIERGPRVLSRFAPIAGEAVRRGMEAAGIEVRTATHAQRVERSASGSVVIELVGGAAGAPPDASSAGMLEADEVIVALGRRPATTDLGIEQFGLEPGTSLAADDTGLVFGVDGRWLYAAGDVTGAALLTHVGKYQARACGDAIVARARGGAALDFEPWSRQVATAQHAAVPQVVFTDPQVARVGLNAPEATGRGISVRVVERSIDVAGATLHADGYQGTAQLVIDTERNVVVGALFVGRDVAELLHAATIAVVGEVPVERLWHAVPSFPTISEVWLRLLESLGS